MRALTLSLVCLLALAPVAMAQDAEEGGLPAAPQIAVDVYIAESGCPDGMTFCFLLGDGVLLDDFVATPGSQVTFHVVNTGVSDHDLTFTDTGGVIVDASNRGSPEDAKYGDDLAKTPLLGAGETFDLTVTFGAATGSLAFVCSVPGHDALGMVGQFNVGGAAVEEHKTIEEFGVAYLAHWVGVISFMLVFVVLFVFYFLFRYGETKEYVDHRTGGPRPAKDADVAFMQVVSPKVVAWTFVFLVATAIVFVIAGYSGGA